MHTAPVGSLDCLLETLDLRRPAAAAHSRRVAAYAGQLGMLVGLPGRQLQALREAALVHEAGSLIGPSVAATDVPGLGTWCGLDDAVAEILWYVTRRFDRHPHAPVAARLLSVAHTFDQLTSPREYYTPLSPETARYAIARESGRCFCPAAVNVLMALRLDRLDEGPGAALLEQTRPEGRADGAMERLEGAEPWRADHRLVISS